MHGGLGLRRVPDDLRELPPQGSQGAQAEIPVLAATAGPFHRREEERDACRARIEIRTERHGYDPSVPEAGTQPVQAAVPGVASTRDELPGDLRGGLEEALILT